MSSHQRTFCTTASGRALTQVITLTREISEPGLGAQDKTLAGHRRHLGDKARRNDRHPNTDTRTGAWVRSLLGRKPTRLVTVAIANKTARTAWAMLTRGEDYRATAVV